MNKHPFEVGDVIHGYAAGYFSGSYDCHRVEEVGNDYIVVRNDANLPDFASGFSSLKELVRIRDKQLEDENFECGMCVFEDISRPYWDY